jgi:hypothetical protein
VMAGLHITILVAVVAFAGYSQYQARMNVRVMQVTVNNLLNAGAERTDVNLSSREVQSNQFAKDHGTGHPFGSIVVRETVNIGAEIDSTTVHWEPPFLAKRRAQGSPECDQSTRP